VNYDKGFSDAARGAAREAKRLSCLNLAAAANKMGDWKQAILNCDKVGERLSEAERRPRPTLAAARGCWAPMCAMRPCAQVLRASPSLPATSALAGPRPTPERATPCPRQASPCFETWRKSAPVVAHRTHRSQNPQNTGLRKPPDRPQRALARNRRARPGSRAGAGVGLLQHQGPVPEGDGADGAEGAQRRRGVCEGRAAGRAGGC